MKKILVVFLVCLCANANCQLLTASRAKHLKECTVRITIPGSNSVGTGFLISNNGTIATCWHVVAPCIKYNPTTKSLFRDKIVVEFQDGGKIEYGIPDALANPIDSAMKYDMCIIVPMKPLKEITPFLKVGNFENVNDGDEIITCGYPFALSRSFLSRGMIGAKIIDTFIMPYNNGKVEKTPRNEAFMDITVNKGNSGGVVYKIGDNENQDEAIGIVDFIITPVGKDISDLNDSLKMANSGGGFVKIGGINPNTSLQMIITTLSNSSDGIGGCISIQYITNLYAIATKKH